MSLSFEWDDRKAQGNLRKHGISFEEASTIFGDSFAQTIHDPLHSVNEDRYVELGESCKRRILVVVFTDRESKIRLVSARMANRRERKDYEEGCKGTA